MFSRPEPQTFTKFLISAGVFLCLAAFVGPTLALRDDGALLVSKRQMAELTPVGRAELLHRQNIEHDIVGRFAIPFGAVIFVVGLALVVIGLPSLRKQERLEQEHSDAKLRKLRRELEPRSDAERKASALETAEENLVAIAQSGAAEDLHGVAEDATSESRESSQAPASAGPPSRSGLIASARQAEDEVVARLVQIAPPRYEVRAQVRLAGTTGFDAILLSDVDQLPDVVVEIKYSRWGGMDDSITSGRISQAAQLALRYQSLSGRIAIGWLILVIFEPVDLPAMRRTLVEKAEQANGLVRFSIVRADEVSELSLPDLRAQ